MKRRRKKIAAASRLSPDERERIDALANDLYDREADAEILELVAWPRARALTVSAGLRQGETDYRPL